MSPDSWLLCSDSCEPWQRKMSAATAAKLSSWPAPKRPTTDADFSELSFSLVLSGHLKSRSVKSLTNIFRLRSFFPDCSGAGLISRGVINSQLCRSTDPTLRDNKDQRTISRCFLQQCTHYIISLMYCINAMLDRWTYSGVKIEEDRKRRE